MLGASLTEAVLADWRTAPVPDKLRAMLGFLEILTLTPEAIGPADVLPVRALGVSDQAIRDAIYVCAAFSMIVRIADAFEFKLREPAEMAKDTGFLLKIGYK